LWLSLEQPLVCNRKIASSDPATDEATKAAIFFVPLDFLPLSDGCGFGAEMLGDGFTSGFLSKPSCVNFSICLLRVLVPPVGGRRGTRAAVGKPADSMGVAGEFTEKTEAWRTRRGAPDTLEKSVLNSADGLGRGLTN